MTVLGALLTATLMFDGGASGLDGGVDAGGGRDGALAVDGTGAGGPDGGAPGDGGTVAGDAKPAALPAVRPLGRLAGHVLAKGGKRPVAGASIIANGAELGETDAHGDFAVDVPCGRRAVSILAPGFERFTTTFDACASDAMTVRLLPAEGGSGYETTVRAKPPQPAVRLTDEELTETPGSLGDPLRVIESLPGVAAVAWPAPIYAVRGSNPGNTGYFLDGVTIPALFHFALGPSVIHPYFFRGVDFFPGGYPARYGRYVGGIVAAETRAPAADAIHTSVDVRLYDAGAMVSAPLAGGAVAAAARYSYTAGLVSLLGEDIRLGYWDYQIRADRRVGAFQLSVFAFGSGDQFSPSRNDSTKELDLGFHRISLRAAVPVGGGSLQGSIAVGTDHSRAPVLDTYPIIVDAFSAAPRLSYGRAFGPVNMAVGFDGQFAHYDPVVIGALQPEGDWDLAKQRDVRLLAGYVSATVAAIRWLTFTPEVRLDTYAVNGTFARDVGPRLSARIALNDETALRAAGGRFTQLPNLPVQIPGAEAFGLKLLGLQSSWQGSLGVETTHFAAIELALTGFLQSYVLTELRNPTASSPDPLADDFLIKREALSYGVELLARRPLTHRLHGWLSYTLSNSVRSYGGGAIGPSDWDQRHILNVVVGYRSGRNTFGARGHLNTGRPDFVFDAAGTEYMRLPTYYQVDLRVDRAVFYDRITLHL
ncbi:MAG TPA: hypothetical protein VNR90_15815, partial [Vicinamibacterales bacterium]|nr:hypothetical protein [Vicinamibacterales bacterium]